MLQYESQVGYQNVTVNVINVPNQPPEFISSLSTTISEANNVCVIIRAVCFIQSIIQLLIGHGCNG